MVLTGCREAIERYFIYFPTREIFLTPETHNVPFEDVEFTAGDGVTLHGWFIPAGKEGSGAPPTLVWFHGNGGNLSHRVTNITLLRHHVRTNIFIYDYRGYGRSEGVPSESGIYRDGEAAVRYLLTRTDVDSGRLVYFGRSLGASVALQEALRHPPAGIILESPFISIAAMAQKLYGLPLGRFLLTRYDNESKIRRLRLPLLVLHGDRDQIVPLKMGRALFDMANEPKDFYVIKGAGHNDTDVTGGVIYFRRLESFILELFGQE